MSVLEIKELVKYYGKSIGVDGVSFTIEEGEIFGFIGPNGAGKSTTIRTILGLIKKTSGDITVFDKNIEDNLIDSLNNIGYLPSEVFYYDKLKAIDLLKYSASFYKIDANKRIKELADYLELDLNLKIDDMSLGNKKKVGIIQGLIHSPKFIVLDEPTSGLDPLIQQKFFNLLREENKKGATILFSSHILGEVQKLCDRVAIIKDGKIVAIENIKQLHELSYRSVTITTNQEIDESLFSEYEITNFMKINDVYTFLFKGNYNKFIQTLGKIDIVALEISEPELEDIFLHYYA